MGNSPADLGEFRDMCDKWNSEVMKPLLKQKEFMYIDLDVLFDFRLGALLSLMQAGEEDYQYIMSNVDKYLSTPTLECAKFFPKFGLSDDQLDDRASDPNYAAVMAAIAPPTRFLGEMKTMIKVINTLNASKETTNPLKITINQGKRKVHPFILENLKKYLLSIDPGMAIDFVKFATWRDVPKELVERLDIIVVYNIKDFLAKGSVPQSILESSQEAFAMTTVMAIRQVDETAMADEAVATKNFLDLMDIFFDKFTFIGKTLMKPEDSENG